MCRGGFVCLVQAVCAWSSIVGRMAQGSGVMTDFVFLLEFGLAAMVFVLSGRDDDYVVGLARTKI